MLICYHTLHTPSCDQTQKITCTIECILIGFLAFSFQTLIGDDESVEVPMTVQELLKGETKV